jgi:O-antigen/teichoic acid export membrane protein
MVILKQSRLAATTIILSDFLRAFLMIGAAIWAHSMLVLILTAVTWMVVRLLLLLVYLRTLGVPAWITPHMGRLKELFHFAVPFGLAGISGTLSDSLPQYVVSHLYTPALFAIYSVGCFQVPITTIIFSSISDVTLVRLGELQKAGNENESARIIGDSVSKICLLLLPTYVWLMVNAREVIVFLFTERFVGSVEIFRIFLAMIVLVALQLDYVPRAFADIGFLLRVNILRLVLTVTLLSFLIGPLGMVGAALSTVVALAASKLIIIFRVKTLLKVTLKQLLPWNQLVRISLASLAAGVVAGLFQMIGRFSLTIELFLSATIFTTVYAVFVWKLSGIGADLKEWVIGRFKHWTSASVGV